MDIEKLIEDLRGLLKQYGEKIPYGELVGAPWPYSRSGDLVWQDPEPYFIEQAATALSALRPVSRERVERVWRGKWKCHGDCGVTECSACGWNIEEYVGDYNFCPACGAPMTDEAVQMVMERMEKLKNEIG